MCVVLTVGWLGDFGPSNMADPGPAGLSLGDGGGPELLHFTLHSAGGRRPHVYHRLPRMHRRLQRVAVHARAGN